MDEKKIFISLDDKRLKDVAESITNKTCNKILQYLVEETATVSDISEKLKLPLNTVDYNIKKLLRAGLIESDSVEMQYVTRPVSETVTTRISVVYEIK